MIIKHKNKKKILPLARREISENRINVKLRVKRCKSTQTKL